MSTLHRCCLETIVQSDLKIDSHGPGADIIAISLSKADELGSLGVLFKRQGGVLQDMGIKFGFMMLLLKDGFCSHLPLVVGNINSKSLLKMHKRHVKRCLKLVFV